MSTSTQPGSQEWMVAEADDEQDPQPGLMLVIEAYGAEPYMLEPVGTYDLADAIEEEARKVADDAGSDLLDDPGQEARDELARRIKRDATLALRGVGDSYTDPTGVVWKIKEEWS